MQTPSGFVFSNGRFEPTNWMDAIFNPSFLWRYAHMLNAAIISAGFFVAGIGAYYPHSWRSIDPRRRNPSPEPCRSS